MAKPSTADDPMKPNNALNIKQTTAETGAQAMARNLLEPHIRHAHTASAFADKLLGTTIEAPGIADYVDHVDVATGKAEAGDLSLASRILVAQAMTLDSMFTELARRAAQNVGEYMDASDCYGRLALKAQSNCRATLDALAKLHQPREQTVRHVHVNEGGQALVADHFHKHERAPVNARNDEQCDAASSAGAGTSLPSPNSQGSGVPVPGRKRKATLPHAWRD